MKIFVQWCTDPPMPYEEFNAGQWASLPFKPSPTFRLNPKKDDRLDTTRGWICAIEVHGKQFNGQDHYHVRQHLDGNLTVTLWNDDPKEAFIMHFPSGKTFFYTEKNWKSFLPPVNPRHGKWMSDELFEKHMELIR